MKNLQPGVAVAVGVLALLAAIGFSSPSSRAEKNEKAIASVREDVDNVKDRVSASETDIAVMKRDIDYSARGIEALLQKEGLTPSPRRRRGP